jgi:hypothetical protein
LAAQRYKTFLDREKRRRKKQDREQDDDAADKFMDRRTYLIILSGLLEIVQDEWAIFPTIFCYHNDQGYTRRRKLIGLSSYWMRQARELLNEEESDKSLFLAIRRSLAFLLT